MHSTIPCRNLPIWGTRKFSSLFSKSNMTTLILPYKANMLTGSKLHHINIVQNEKLGIPPFWLPVGKIEKSVLIWGTNTCT